MMLTHINLRHWYNAIVFPFWKIKVWFVLSITMGCAQITHSGNLLPMDFNHFKKSPEHANQILLLAASQGDIKGVKYALDMGADINSTDARGNSILEHITSFELEPDNINEIKFLLENGANPLLENENGTPLLHKAVANNDMPLVKLLLTSKTVHQIQIDQKDAQGFAAIFYAVARKNLPMLNLLLEEGKANIAIIDPKHDTIAHCSASYNQLDMIQYLFKKAPSLFSITNNEGLTPLFMAAANGAFDVVKYCVAQGEDPSAIKGGGTLLEWVACNGYADMFCYLVETCSIPLYNASSTTSPLVLSIKHNKMNVVACIIDYLEKHQPDIIRFSQIYTSISQSVTSLYPNVISLIATYATEEYVPMAEEIIDKLRQKKCYDLAERLAVYQKDAKQSRIYQKLNK